MLKTLLKWDFNLRIIQVFVINFCLFLENLDYPEIGIIYIPYNPESDKTIKVDAPPSMLPIALET